MHPERRTLVGLFHFKPEGGNLRIGKYMRTMFAGMAMWGMLVPQPATSHPSTEDRYRQVYSEPGFCVLANARQDHTWHRMETTTRNSCGAFATTHTQYQQYYKVPTWGAPGTYCFSEGWHQSPPNVTSWVKFYDYDIWYWCNNGGGVNVWLSIDSWQYSYKPNYGFVGAPWRPASRHCHCP